MEPRRLSPALDHDRSPSTRGQGDAWQILVGSGGSRLKRSSTDPTINPETDRDYAWATVKFYKSGKVKITVYGFDDHYGTTHLLQSITLR